MRLPKVGEVCEVLFKDYSPPIWEILTVKDISTCGDMFFISVGGEELTYTVEELRSLAEFRFDDSNEEHSECHTSGNELGMYRPDLNTRKLGKVQMELVDTGFPNALFAIAEVMSWAAQNKGYKPNDWKDLPDSFMAFTGAAGRHRVKRLRGEELDDESGLLHLAHEAFNILALLETTLLEDER